MQTAALFQNLVSCLCRQRFKGPFALMENCSDKANKVTYFQGILERHEWQQLFGNATKFSSAQVYANECNILQQLPKCLINECKSHINNN